MGITSFPVSRERELFIGVIAINIVIPIVEKFIHLSYPGMTKITVFITKKVIIRIFYIKNI